MSDNGCNLDGWDLFEGHTRLEFEEYAIRRGYLIERVVFFYVEQRTEDAWQMYHRGHVSGRSWGKND